MSNISSWTELNAARNQPFTSFTLIADLKITDLDYDGIGNAWTPLCYDYQATFDGAGHYIEGLSAPLFSSLYMGGTVTKLGMKNVNITNGLGSIANGLMYTSIDNCWVSGSVSGGGTVGGLIGGCYYAGITNCYSSATINGSGASGGIVGDGYQTTGCFSTGTVNGSPAGGLAGNLSVEGGCGWVTTQCSDAIGSYQGGGPASVAYSEATSAPYYYSSHPVYGGWDFTNTWHTNTGALPTLRAIGTTPTTPVLSISSSRSGSISLSWTASVTLGGEIIGYKIERAIPGGSYASLVANTGNTNLTYTDSTAVPGSDYNYRVSGLSYGSPSTVSNVVRGVSSSAALFYLADGVETPLGSYHYWGDPSTNGSYRIHNASGVIQLQERTADLWIDTTWSEVDPEASGLVPYIGAMGNVDLGTHELFATKLGVGTTSPTVPLHIHRTSADYIGPCMLFDGKSIVGTGTTDGKGFGLYLSYNLSGNRQFVFGDTETGQGVRFINNYLDGFNVNGTILDLNLGGTITVKADTSGVGIGTSSPGAKLGISATGDVDPILSIVSTSTAHGYPKMFEVVCNDNSSDPSFTFKRATASNGNFNFGIHGGGAASYLTITSALSSNQLVLAGGGAVLIGTTTDDTISKFQVAGKSTLTSSADDTPLALTSSYNAGDGGACRLELKNASNNILSFGMHNGTGDPFAFFWNQTEDLGKIKYYGQVGKGSNLYAGKGIFLGNTDTAVYSSVLNPTANLYVAESMEIVSGAFSQPTITFTSGYTAEPTAIFTGVPFYVYSNTSGSVSFQLQGTGPDNYFRSWGSALHFQAKDGSLQYPICLNEDGGNVLIGTVTDDTVNKLQVNGSAVASLGLTAGINTSIDVSGTPFYKPGTSFVGPVAQPSWFGNGFLFTNTSSGSKAFSFVMNNDWGYWGFLDPTDSSAYNNMLFDGASGNIYLNPTKGSTLIGAGVDNTYGMLQIDNPSAKSAIIINGGAGFFGGPSSFTSTVDISNNGQNNNALAVHGEVLFGSGTFTDPRPGEAWDLKMGGSGAGAIATLGNISTQGDFLINSAPIGVSHWSNDANYISTGNNASLTTLALTQTTGTPPLTVTSVTRVANLNADMVDGKHYTDMNPMTALGDIIYGGASGVPTRLAIGSANTVLHGGSTPAYSAIVEADITLAANTTNNATAARHGFCPTLGGTSALYLNGAGNWSTPTGTNTNGYSLTNFTGQTSVTVTHNFGTFPIVQVVENSGTDHDVFTPYTIKHTSVNSFTVTFSTATDGHVMASVGSPQPQAITTVSDNYTVLLTDRIIICTVGGKTITLPTTVGHSGFEVIVDNASTGDITVAPNTGSQTIQGETSQIVPPNSAMNIYTNASVWRIY